MRVVLYKDIKGLGKLGDIVSVKPGFARNYLLRFGYGMRATAEELERFEKNKAEIARKNQESKAAAEIMAEAIGAVNLIFICQAGDDGRLYGSVGAKEIAKRLKEEVRTDVPASSIHLAKRIKDVGIYDIEVLLHADVSVNITINISRSEEEARIALEKRAKEAVENKSAEILAAAEVITPAAPVGETSIESAE